jgi:hypothetical protein
VLAAGLPALVAEVRRERALPVLRDVDDSERVGAAPLPKGVNFHLFVSFPPLPNEVT